MQRELQPSLACSTQSKRRRRPAYVNQSPRNWHWTKKLITKIVHPRPLGPRAPSALSGESRHPRPLVPPPPAPRTSSFYLLRMHLFPDTITRPWKLLIHHRYILLPASWLYVANLECVGERAERSISRFLLYACDLSFHKNHCVQTN